MTGLSGSLRVAADQELLAGAGVVLLLLSAWRRERITSLVSILSVGALVAAAFVAVSFQGVGFGGLIVADGFASYAKVLIYAAAAMCLIMAPRWLSEHRALASEFPLLILFSSAGMSLMVSATDFVALYVGLELQSLSAYVLASFWRDDIRSTEAGLKYFVLGALASGILLFGVSLVYGFSGSTGFALVGAAFGGSLSTGALFGLVFVLAGLAFKISAVPFHVWTPDVYEGAPTPVTTFFASAPKVAALALTVRVLLQAFIANLDAWQQIVIFIALASIILGAVGAIGQRNLKRLLAYSSINNIGFLLIGLACGTREGVAALLVYLAIYVPMTVGSFAYVMMLGVDDAGRSREELGDVAGLSRTRPALALLFAIFMFSLAGIPPLFGFWAKLVVFQAAVRAGLLPLAAIGIAASVISAFYYIMVVRAMYFDEPEVGAEQERRVSPAPLTTVAGLSAVAVSPVGYFAIPWLSAAADGAARALI